MRIVLTNDDGIDAPGILALKQALEKVGEVLTVAPDKNRSGVGRSITLGTPLRVEKRELADGSTGYACTGTPVDCVRLVSLGLMDFEPDVVVSGINHGENMGDDITYSGTVAAAFEGIVVGVPGVAVSLSMGRAWHSGAGIEKLHFEPVAAFAARLAVRAVVDLPPERILNVNAPNLAARELNGARVTYLGRRVYRDELVEVEDEEGVTCYDIYNNPPHYREGDGTDFAALAAGEISVTPVHLDLTDHKGLGELKSWSVADLLSNGASGGASGGVGRG